MGPERKLYAWAEIGEILPKTGIYAWYCKHTFTEFDIGKLVADLAGLPAEATQEAKDLVQRFLETHLFSVFVEDPYDASITGPLKPAYAGQLHHAHRISEDLVARIAQEPGRLRVLKKVLEDAVPEFASPIYIGMSDNLHRRIGRHKKLIETYRAGDAVPMPGLSASPAEKADHSFARDVARRGFSLNRLVVSVRCIDAPGNVHVDAENILNRINYPLCGRN
jgi:hypothetical protein